MWGGRSKAETKELGALKSGMGWEGAGWKHELPAHKTSVMADEQQRVGSGFSPERVAAHDSLSKSSENWVMGSTILLWDDHGWGLVRAVMQKL